MLTVATPVRYCLHCGNCDCPNVSSAPYWKRCPATERIRLASRACTCGPVKASDYANAIVLPHDTDCPLASAAPAPPPL